MGSVFVEGFFSHLEAQRYYVFSADFLYQVQYLCILFLSVDTFNLITSLTVINNLIFICMFYDLFHLKHMYFLIVGLIGWKQMT